jgi:predicted ATP-dependent Lon-type protease
MMETILSPRSPVGINTEVVGRLSVIQVLGENTVFDEDFFSSIHAFVIHWVGTIPAHEGWVVNNRYQVITDFLTKFSVQT